MCVIILRNAGVSIPFEMIKTACHVNPDGWGVAVADRGQLTVQHGLENGKENDPDVVYKVMEDAKDKAILLHLRYITAGKKTLSNCHPFSILKSSQHGTDVVMAHNGTLHSWKDGDEFSDSYHFANKYAIPLFQRSVLFTGPEKVLHDEFTQLVLKREIGSNSIVTFFDGNASFYTVNHTNGYEHDGWWSSNKYSFESTHRSYESGKYGYKSYIWDKDKNELVEKDENDDDYYHSWPTYYDYKTRNGHKTQITHTQDNTNAPFELDSKDASRTSASSSNSTDSPDVFPIPDQNELEREASQAEQCAQIKKVLKSMQQHPKISQSLITTLLNQKRTTFCDLVGINSLSEMTRFDITEIEELVGFYPEAASLLILDLLHLLYMKEAVERAKTQRATGQHIEIKTSVPAIIESQEKALKVANG
jgi:predicted glutamine amidotransferase